MYDSCFYPECMLDKRFYCYGAHSSVFGNQQQGTTCYAHFDGVSRRALSLAVTF